LLGVLGGAYAALRAHAPAPAPAPNSLTGGSQSPP
jgi:hypothetical protein